MSISDRLRHWFHVVSNIRPIVWITSYVALTPIFAVIYWLLPDGQFRIPDGGTTDFGSWLYYSIVTITTLGFGDYTPMGAYSQLVTAVEVMCGLIILGFFLNAVGSMKSEIDVTSEVEKQRRLHKTRETDKLKRSIPTVMHCLNTFLSYCYAVTTPRKVRGEHVSYNPDFKISDMTDMYKPSGLSEDLTKRPAVQSLMQTTFRTSICLDSLQTRVDLELWPDLLEDCFNFVANAQVFTSAEKLQTGIAEADEPALAAEIASRTAENKEGAKKQDSITELYYFIKENAGLARKIETALTEIASAKDDE